MNADFLVAIGPLWAAAIVLFGFQLAGLVWRLNREVWFRDRQPKIPNWITVADYMVYASILVLVIGVFVLPVLGVANLLVSGWMFALSIVIFGLAPAVLAGHYELYRRPTFPNQRKESISGRDCPLGGVFCCLWVLRLPFGSQDEFQKLSKTER